MRLSPAAALLLGLAACATEAPPAPSAAPVSPSTPSAGLPREGVRSAAIDANSWFARPRAGQPAAAARAMAQLEFVAQNLPNDPHYAGANPGGLNQLQIARREARTALGIPASATSDDVVRGLRDAAIALETNNMGAARTALRPDVFTAGPEETIRRLGAPPRVPSARPALAALTVR